MKEKMTLPGDLSVKQELWVDSPCSDCRRTPCCRNLPLAPFHLNTQSDFISLILTSCYNGIYPALKQSGEWTIYLERDCSFLNDADGKCSIHAQPHQSLICKSYDAHKCWYVDAFRTDGQSTMILFNTDLLIWYEKRYSLIINRFNADIEWDELCRSVLEYGKDLTRFNAAAFEPWSSRKLSFKKSRSQDFLFFPPFKRPQMKSHFELLSFRLGYPGTYLAVTDSCWAFMIKTGINAMHLNQVRREYYPALDHRDGAFSFDRIMNEHHPYSQSGDQWIILQRKDLETLKNLTVFEESGKIRRLPSSQEILSALNSGGNPHQAA